VVAEVCIESEEHLRVTMGDVTVADGDDRFIPRGDAVFAYSKHGSNRRWKLPPHLRGKELQVFTLGVDGRGPASDCELFEDAIRLELEAGVPVKIVEATAIS
jgi:hypothetical protein